MENISRGLSFGDFVTFLTEGSIGQQGCKTTEYKSSQSPPSIKCNVPYCVRVSLRKVKIFHAEHWRDEGRWVISIYLWTHWIRAQESEDGHTPNKKPKKKFLVLKSWMFSLEGWRPRPELGSLQWRWRKKYTVLKFSRKNYRIGTGTYLVFYILRK